MLDGLCWARGLDDPDRVWAIEDCRHVSGRLERARHDPTTAAYLARKQAEGMNRMEALRCLKRYLARRVWHLLTDPARTPQTVLGLT